jgi:hypothetical protein
MKKFIRISLAALRLSHLVAVLRRGRHTGARASAKGRKNASKDLVQRLREAGL